MTPQVPVSPKLFSTLGPALPMTLTLILGLLLTLPAAAQQADDEKEAPPNLEALEKQLMQAETDFAAAFAEAKMEAFASFLDEDAVFMGRNTPLRGKKAIVERWTRMRGTEEAPFSWRPERVAVEANGELGMSTGPVMAPDGTWTSSYVSTWRRTKDGWRVVLDVGPRCPPATPSEP